MSERTPLLRRRRPAAYRVLVAALLLLFLLVAYRQRREHALARAEEQLWTRNLGTYAPLVPSRVPPLPRGCVVDQVSVLHRHTARYPTSGAAARMRPTLAKLAHATVPPSAAFLRTADLNMTGWAFGELTEPGREAARNSAHAFAYRLALFVRSAGSRRVLDTAHLFLSALGSGSSTISVTIPEGPTVNNTLCVHNCAAQTSAPAAPEIASVMHLLSPAARRLSGLLEIELTETDIPNIAGMCGYDTARVGKWSAWCSLLNATEWEAVGYVSEVARWYGFGGASAGWVNELVARLNDSLVVDGTCTNRTLDADPATFPLGKRLFLDFTHDNEMVAIQAALGISRHMPTSVSTVPHREWVLSSVVPFGARWRFERVVCGEERYVRMLVNDRVMPVERPECGGSLCQLGAFVASQRESRERDWSACVADRGNLGPRDNDAWVS
ncbi:hypothetical protein CspeluHIS016_0306070 [Cutaneotrichosporon spelunceum]|uniref:Phytase A n=1 Tax=Cutaneotrichosporon spelunceum TaxID=1672016 RepID=A0AAD3YCB0_9TREE|nr:hypothetical protein CspeluHIS016_0306070 [Cutaneotrichosporon spelunceum]